MARARTRAESGTTSAAVLGTITAFLTLLTAVIGLMVRWARGSFREAETEAEP